jgi:DNA modification methylase
MGKLDAKSIQTIITSPPYGLGKKYGIYADIQNLDKWKDLIESALKQAHRILKPNGSFFLNVSPIPYGKKREILPLDFIAYELAKNSGFFLRNKIIWHFNNMQNCVQRLSGRWEAILWLVKDLDNYIFNLDAIRLPYLTKGDKRLEGGKGRNPTDVWYFDRVNNMTKGKLDIEHPCVYPLDMIERIIRMSTNPNDWIVDPFLGSGTTLVACKRLQRNGLGFEIDRKWEKTIEHRLLNEGQQLKLF